MAMPAAAAGLAALLSLSAPAPVAPPTPVVAGALDEDGDPASTAVALRPADARMTVSVTVDGAGPFRFIVDSGATRTVISSRLAALLRLPAAGMVALHSVGGESTVPSVRIERLTLGGLAARTITAPVLEQKDLGAPGILGIDALAGKKVVIDLDANRMTIEKADRREAPAASNEIVVVARRRYGQLVLADADAAGQRIYAVVDTGSEVTIGNGPLHDRLVARRRAAPVPTIITDVAGREVTAFYAPISDIRLSDWHIRNAPVAFSDVHAFRRFGLDAKPSMLLGMDMMRVFSRVSIDFRRQTVRLLRRADPLPPA